MTNERRKGILNKARHNRVAPTGAEARLHLLLKAMDIGRLRTQVDVGNIIVDFGIPRRNLLIEVDGGSHEEKSDQDGRRDYWLLSLGFIVLRVSNEDVLDRGEEFVQVVLGYPESEENRSKFNLALQVARKQSDLTHPHQPPPP